MSPARQAVRSIVRSWRMDVEWREDEWERLADVLSRLSQANGGRVFLDASLDQASFNAHFRATCEGVIGRAMRVRARRLASAPAIPYQMVDATGPKPSLPLLQARRTTPRIDINKATQRTLTRRAGLTDGEARSILAARKAARGFAELSEVEQVLGKATWSRLEHQIYIGREDATWDALFPAQRSFVRFPTMKNYLRMTDASSPRPTSQAERKAALFATLDEILGETQPTPGFSPRRVTAASEIIRARKMRGIARAAERQSARDLTGVTLLTDSQYLRFLKAALGEASESIRITMFFLMHRPDKRNALTPVLEELRAARRRQVDVRVILDKDSPTDVFNSRRINRAAFRFLVDNDIPVVFSSANRVVHSKIVLIDRRHVLLGSHNWTLGSMFHYDEKSVYIESPRLGALLEERFQQLWRNPEEKAAFRDQLLPTVAEDGRAMREAGVYSVDDFLQSSGSPEQRDRLAQRSALPVDRIVVLRGDITLRDLEARIGAATRTFPARIEALNRSVRKSPGRCRVLSVIPGETKGSFTLFTLTDERGERRDLPFRLAPGARATVRVGIANRTDQDQEYRLRTVIGVEPAFEHGFRLGPGEERTQEISFYAPTDGCKRVVSLALQQGEGAPFRTGSVYLMVTGDARVSARSGRRRRT